MPAITKDITKKIAQLAKLQLTEAEEDKFTSELSGILDFVHKVNDVDTSEFDVVSHIDDFVGSRLRKDEPEDSLPLSKVTLNATGGRAEGNYITTSKII